MPHSYDLTASCALSLALCVLCRCLQSGPLADQRIYSGPTEPQAAGVAVVAAIARVPGPRGRQQRGSASNVFVIIFGCDRPGVNMCVTRHGGRRCAPPRSGTGWGGCVRRMMKRMCIRVALGVDRGVLWVGFIYKTKKKCEYLFAATVTSCWGVSERLILSFQLLTDAPA